MEGYSSVADAVRDRMGELSPAERKVARTLLASYPAAGLETVARLADRAGVSAPSVVRFATRLGFDGYPDLQRALRDELEERNASPLVIYRSRRGSRPDGESHLLDRARHVLPEGVARTLEAMPPDELDRAVALLADRHRRITIAGGRFTRLLGHYLVLHLMQIRGGSRLLPESTVERADVLVDIGPKDVFVLLDHRRYERATADLATRVSDRGAKIVLLTDRWMSPVASRADVVLPARVDSVSAYDSLIPTLAVVEVLVAGVLAASGESAEERLADFERASTQHTLL